jgi:succinate dehydrogenase / fumarate reductase iron-sulfur subunit
MQVTLKVLRFDPNKDGKPEWRTYQVEAEPWDRVLDLLHKVKADQDGTLAFRRSCGHGICGSDAMLINGRNRLACKTLVKDLGSVITVEPIRGLPVEKDLIVDMEPFFAAYRAVKPYLINDEPPPQRERLQSPEERERFDHGTKCILCASCTTSCPVFWVNGAYIGPRRHRPGPPLHL